jgi:hypothetical protein
MGKQMTPTDEYDLACKRLKESQKELKSIEDSIANIDLDLLDADDNEKKSLLVERGTWEGERSAILSSIRILTHRKREKYLKNYELALQNAENEATQIRLRRDELKKEFDVAQRAEALFLKGEYRTLDRVNRERRLVEVIGAFEAVRSAVQANQQSWQKAWNTIRRANMDLELAKTEVLKWDGAE